MILKQIAIASLIVIDVMRSANSGQAVKLFYKSTFLQQYNSIFNTTLDSLPIQFSNTQLLVLLYSSNGEPSQSYHQNRH